MYKILETKKIDGGVCLLCGDEPAILQISFKKANEEDPITTFKICNTCLDQIRNI